MDFSAKMLRDDALKGKTIVVTGGGSGLGKAMTQYFLELGANVAITSRDLDKLKNSCRTKAATGGSVCRCHAMFGIMMKSKICCSKS
jgi:short-subunit dehydrogenase involved in D-alanine esterification of teichoic acids